MLLGVAAALLFPFALLTSMAGQAATNSEAVGVITDLAGKVSVRDKYARRNPAEMGAGVALGDMVGTGDKARAEISMADNSVFRVSANSKLVIDRFIIGDANDRELKARFIDGAFQYISRRKYARDDTQIGFGRALIGIRGTNFVGLSGKKNQLVLLSGAIDVNLGEALVTMNRPNQSLIFSKAGAVDSLRILSAAEIKALGDNMGWPLEPEADARVSPSADLSCRNPRLINNIRVCD